MYKLLFDIIFIVFGYTVKICAPPNDSTIMRMRRRRKWRCNKSLGIGAFLQRISAN